MGGHESRGYELIDCGARRKLERFGTLLLDRPSPAAVDIKKYPSAWRDADARYERDSADAGRWIETRPIPGSWPVAFGPFTLEARRTPSGQVGIFPEQAGNWRWIAEQVTRFGPLKVLNLFAYTGASTLAAAAAGAEVVHVDAAAGIVAWARRNAELSRLAGAPIRWIAEDAQAFVRRELKRGNRYDAVILDPPAFGHGPQGQSWKLEDDLAPLLAACWQLLQPGPKWLLVTCHSGELAFAANLRAEATAVLPELAARGTLAASDMHLESHTGARLHAGAAVRWHAGRK